MARPRAGTSRDAHARRGGDRGVFVDRAVVHVGVPPSAATVSMIDPRVFEWAGEVAGYHPAALHDGRFDHVLPLLYPPFAAVGFAALDVLSFNGPQTLQSVTVIASVLAGVYLTLGTAARRRSDLVRWQIRAAATSALGAAFLWLEPVQPALVWRAYETWTRRGPRGTLALGAVTALFFAYPTRADPSTGRWDNRVELLPKGVLGTVPCNHQRELTWGAWQQVVGNLYVILGSAVLVAEAAWLAKTRAQPYLFRALRARHGRCAQTHEQTDAAILRAEVTADR